MQRLNLRWLLYLTIVLLAAPASPVAASQGHGIQHGATPATGAWEVVEERNLAIEGDLVTLSPDGQWIAGLGDDSILCVWPVANGDAVCDPDHDQINAQSLTWAPDSSAVAYTQDAAAYLIDSDILAFDVATGTTTNLTDDAYDGRWIPRGDTPPEAILVDLFPTWLPDSSGLVFARSDVMREISTNDLMMIDRAGGEPTLLHQTGITDAGSINSPILVLADGTVLYAIATTDVSDDENGIWRLAPDGEATQLMPGGPVDAFPAPALTAANPAGDPPIVSGYSRQRAGSVSATGPLAFELNAATGEIVPLGTETLTVTPYRYSPDGASTVSAHMIDFVWHIIITDPGGGQLDLGTEVYPSPWINARGIDWANNNTLLLTTGREGGWLITIAQSSGE
jgi:WD40 repeat protein